ncbi:MAG TPA: hypothetical protein VG106_14265, partial [Vicinamibacterales bacterium]|nr:hypothetical protein [Vicinamibacterales bacterium]
MDTIRVWLEPGYDHGRTGAWMLDWPGAFTWGTSREGAMARVPSAVHRFVEWLDEHGDEAATTGRVPAVAEVVDEVPTQRLDDGYQVMATFDADGRDVSDEELRRHIDRMRYARADLLEIIDGLQSLIGSGAELKLEDRDAQGLASGAAAGREIEEVLAHIAQTDAWFVSRLDASARYDGPRQDNVDAFLQQSLEFLLARLTAIQAADPRAKRVAGRGETWT